MNIDWDGRGLPPVGTVCEMSVGDVSENRWILGTVVAHVELDRPVAIAHDCEDVFHGYAGDFRAVKTPEKSRERAIEEMLSATNCTGNPWRERFGCLYDAGYRKFEIVEEDL